MTTTVSVETRESRSLLVTPDQVRHTGEDPNRRRGRGRGGSVDLGSAKTASKTRTSSASDRSNCPDPYFGWSVGRKWSAG